ncbi:MULTISPECIES: hypothetical protein [Leuconostoc]|mgnify:CR=1 FL=1|uniref:PrgI family protein n=1 Tax=Leuconostoc inhae TaxID=178001 RepID=A0AAN2QU40_9LACO|nr:MULTISPECIES: hypothetical protein [Leuconostoc]MBZ5947835.1 hypothetical protein [Leuconostoc gasicomitatum]MBZ5955677.1 hypothetical protein [Leuconostoc gasicomitatum]MBZ5960705.1 hypothetical protein [Leuconostoc gasicomitatum]MBZ5979915.1 hypothetical protein [Leuconostoc gasicomitatum]MBZ5983291.1 hypothetical protein [Leuconostoc gasicomitatum]
MASLQSEFHPDLSKFEPVYWGGLTKPQLKMGLQLMATLIPIGAEVFFVKGALFWLVAIPTAAILVIPIFLKGSGQLEKFKKSIEYNVRIHARYYLTGQIRSYEAHEFTQKENVSEANRK